MLANAAGCAALSAVLAKPVTHRERTMKKLLGIALLVGAILGMPFAAQPADAPATPPAAEKKARALPFRGKVGAVDKVAKTVTLEGSERARVFQITSQSKIRKDKKPATLDEVMVGDRVGGSQRESADGKLEVVTLNVTSATPKK